MRKPMDEGKQEKLEKFDIKQGLASDEETAGTVIAPLLSVAESARYLGVGRTIIYRLFEDGRVTGVREGRALRIERASLDAFISSGELT